MCNSVRDVGGQCVPSNGPLLFGILFNDKQSYVAIAESQLGHYLIDSSNLEIGECIGEGASGIVYRGLYKGQQKVAVKELKGVATKNSKIEGEFRREVLILITCAHKNVLKLYGIGLSSSLGIHIVTKFMEGGSLLQYIVQRKGLTTKEIIKLARDVAKGMQFLHSKGIIHMDLKTANVFLDENGNAVIGDLGIARLVNEKDEASSDIGTYRWMAPEVCAGVISESRAEGSPWFSFKSDVYSFGILLWELVTCKLPYADYNPVQAAVGVVMHGLRPTLPPSIFPPFSYLIKKCWDQNPSIRPHFSQILQMLDIISLHEHNSKP